MSFNELQFFNKAGEVFLSYNPENEEEWDKEAEKLNTGDQFYEFRLVSPISGTLISITYVSPGVSKMKFLKNDELKPIKGTGTLISYWEQMDQFYSLARMIPGEMAFTLSGLEFDDAVEIKD